MELIMSCRSAEYLHCIKAQKCCILIFDFRDKDLQVWKGSRYAMVEAAMTVETQLPCGVYAYLTQICTVRGRLWL